jgi:hypothetical protein
MRIILTSENHHQWQFTAVLDSGREESVTVKERGKPNRRETEYDLVLGNGHVWRVILLSMPNSLCPYAWRIPDERHIGAGAGQAYVTPLLALQNGAIPYVVAQELGD